MLIASDSRDARLASLGGLGLLFDFEKRTLPRKIIDSGSPRSQLAKRSDRESRKLVNETAIDQPSAHGFHLFLVCRSKWNGGKGSGDPSRSARSFCWPAHLGGT